MIYEKIVNVIDKEKVLKDVPLCEHISFKVGGPCDCMVFPSSADDIAAVVGTCIKEGISYYILGNGTNVIALDEGFNGVVVKIGKNFDRITVDGTVIKAQAGASLASVSKKALDNSLAGMEFAGGIPGSIGGGVMMNAGAYGGELKNIVKSVTALSKDGEVYTLTGEQCEFGYRNSIFQNNQSIVLEAEFELSKGNPEEIHENMMGLMKRRNEKQPLSYASAGSTFKRPDGYFAGKLIQDSGLKGLVHGGAQVSELHAGFVINRGNATAKDILELIELIKNTVFDKYGVELHEEVRIIK